jgi:hypothetical protein
MFKTKKEDYSSEIAKAMQVNLEKVASADDEFEQLENAINMLSKAAEILDSVGMKKAANKVTEALESINF